MADECVDRPMRLLILLLATSVALPAAATTFSARYPAGSITSASQADAALKDADAEMKRVQQDAQSRDAACYRGLLVNSCREDVRRDKQLAEREVRRVQLEARELQRRLEAEAVTKRRAAEAETQAAKDAERSRKKEAVRSDQTAREAKLKQRDDAARADSGADSPATVGDLPKKNMKGTPSKSAQPPRSPSPDTLTAAERADNARKFEQKQAEAAERAREQQAQREKNEQRRAEKRKEMEQREAEREALRQKAAQLPK